MAGEETWAQVIGDNELTDETIRSFNDKLIYSCLLLAFSSVAAYYGVLKESDITPIVTITEEKIIRFLDKTALSRIFANILSNAVKYSDGDLEITLKDNGEITFSNMASALDETQVGKLFDRFYTVENARTSTGLGLSIAKTLAEQMNGKIYASYNDSTLTIHLNFN